jgi:hypothetical protein
VRYFYLTNGASEILVGEDRLVLIRGDPISLFEIMSAMEIWAGVSITALLF